MRIYLPPSIPPGKYRLEIAMFLRDNNPMPSKLKPEGVDTKNLSIAYDKDLRTELFYAAVGYFDLK
jgi:hypothetical protein